MRSHFPTAQIKRPAGGPGSCVPVGRNLTNLFRYGIRFYTELEAEAGRPPAGSIKLSIATSEARPRLSGDG